MTHLLQLLLVLALVVAAAKLSGAAANRVGQPAVFGEILAGLVLGPTVLDVLGWPIFAHTIQPAHGGPPGPLIPQRTVALVFVSAAHDPAVRAVNYARSLRANETRAVFFALDPSEVDQIQQEWEQRRIPIALDIVEAPFRDMTAPILGEVRRVTQRPDSVCAVIVPELVVKKWWHNLLHNQRALFIKRLLLFEPRVILSSVPYQLQ